MISFIDRQTQKKAVIDMNRILQIISRDKQERISAGFFFEYFILIIATIIKISPLPLQKQSDKIISIF